ncbi:YesL family protein [Bacillaceae bacterium Marseille-Q3522]|nr:YesL family protein [Bacillaceae bacterium Marseille-Q3522]
MEGLFAGIYRISEWITKLMYVNLMWIICTITGLGVLGIFPATSAMFAVTRRWVIGEKDIPVFRTFWQYFKADFIKVNILGYLLTILGVFLFIDLKFFQSIIHPVYSIISMIFVVLLFLYFVVILYIFPIYVHYDLKLREYIKYALIIAIGRPMQTLAMMLGVIIDYLFFSYLPALIPFLGASLFSFFLMLLSYISFQKIRLS